MIGRRIFLKTAFLPFLAGLPTVQAGQGGDYIRATDYADLATAVAVAKTTAHRKLYMPAGDYPIGGLNLDADNLLLFGDGPQTRLISDGAVANGVLPPIP